MQGTKHRIHARLSSYWKLELGNAALIPVIMVFLCFRAEQAVGPGLALACVPMSGLLVLGGLYWRAKLLQLEGSSDSLEWVLGQAAKWRLPLLATTCFACVLAAVTWVADLAASPGERWAITAAAALAALEYMNYCHRQLRHFDNLPDAGFRSRKWRAICND
ncbi:MAG: hypothetical protein AAFR88_05935 [Pseudomonadota bacterium]